MGIEISRRPGLRLDTGERGEGRWGIMSYHQNSEQAHSELWWCIWEMLWSSRYISKVNFNYVTSLKNVILEFHCFFQWSLLFSLFHKIAQSIACWYVENIGQRRGAASNKMTASHFPVVTSCGGSCIILLSVSLSQSFMQETPCNERPVLE